MWKWSGRVTVTDRLFLHLGYRSSQSLSARCTPQHKILFFLWHRAGKEISRPEVVWSSSVRLNRRCFFSASSPEDNNEVIPLSASSTHMAKAVNYSEDTIVFLMSSTGSSEVFSHQTTVTCRCWGWTPVWSEMGRRRLILFSVSLWLM